MLYRVELLVHHSIAATTSELKPEPLESSVFIAIIAAPGATPLTEPFAATMPATCVPWP